MRRSFWRPLLAALTISPCLSMVGGTAAAQVLTLPQALSIALAEHPELAAARHEVDAAEAAALQAGARPHPVLGAEILSVFCAFSVSKGHLRSSST